MLIKAALKNISIGKSWPIYFFLFVLKMKYLKPIRMKNNTAK